MINRTVLVGRITKTPELKYTQSNIAFSKFTLAVNRTFGDKETDFVQCIVWRKQAENLCKFVTKGSLLGLEGRIQTGSYDDKDGKRVYTTDIVCDSVQFLEPKGDTQSSPQYTPNHGVEPVEIRPNIDISSDDLPY